MTFSTGKAGGIPKPPERGPSLVPSPPLQGAEPDRLGRNQFGTNPSPTKVGRGGFPGRNLAPSVKRKLEKYLRKKHAGSAES